MWLVAVLLVHLLILLTAFIVFNSNNVNIFKRSQMKSHAILLFKF